MTCDGRLIGVNTAISTVPNSAGVAGGGSVGIGFAVPATAPAAGHRRDPGERTGKSSMARVHRHRDPRRGRQSVRHAFRAVHSAGQRGGPAADGGLKPGDLITGLAGVPATSTTQSALLLTAKVGDTVAVTYQRRGASAETTFTLAEQP